MTEWSEERVRQTRQAFSAVIQPILAEKDDVKAAEIFSAIAEIVAALLVVVAQGDMERNEQLFLIFAELITDRVPEFEKIRAAHTATTGKPH